MNYKVEKQVITFDKGLINLWCSLQLKRNDIIIKHYKTKQHQPSTRYSKLRSRTKLKLTISLVSG